MAPCLTIKQWVLSHIILLLCLFLCLQQFLDITNNNLSLSILDIGQGDAILIQTPEYKNILIDASLGSQVVDRLSEQFGFFEKNKTPALFNFPLLFATPRLNKIVFLLTPFSMPAFFK